MKKKYLVVATAILLTALLAFTAVKGTFYWLAAKDRSNIEAKVDEIYSLLTKNELPTIYYDLALPEFRQSSSFETFSKYIEQLNQMTGKYVERAHKSWAVSLSNSRIFYHVKHRTSWEKGITADAFYFAKEKGIWKLAGFNIHFEGDSSKLN